MNGKNSLPTTSEHGALEPTSGSKTGYEGSGEKIVLETKSLLTGWDEVVSLLGKTGQTGKIASQLGVTPPEINSILGDRNSEGYSTRLGVWMHESEFEKLEEAVNEYMTLPRLRETVEDQGAEEIEAELPAINYVLEIREIQTEPGSRQDLETARIGEELPEDHSLYSPALERAGQKYLERI